jgi:benzoate-CoA ligase family protein
LVVDTDINDRLGSVFDGLPHLRSILISGSPTTGLSFEALVAAASTRLEPEVVSDDDMAFWLYTSGTTGFPKAAVHSHRDLLACRYYGEDVLGVNASDRVFATSKLFFAYALGNALLIPLFFGAQTYLHPEWANPELVDEVLEQYAPTIFFSVPTFYARMLRANLDPERFRSVRYAVSAGERLPVEIYRAWRQRFGIEILDGMGATETIFLVLANRPGMSREGSSGMPVPGSEVRLLNQAGEEAGTGEQGVLQVKTPSASSRYWNRVEQSRRTFIGEWFRTGDVYSRDADGYFYHAGREDDLFKVAGMWVSPADVETALQAHPNVSDVGVVGTDEPGGLVKPFAFVVPTDPTADPQALVASVEQLAAQRLAPHQRPRKIFVLNELPRTETGKVQRFKLREQAHALMMDDKSR